MPVVSCGDRPYLGPAALGRIEFTTIVKYYFGDCAYACAQIGTARTFASTTHFPIPSTEKCLWAAGLNGALQSLNIISVIQSAQQMDNAISTVWGTQLVSSHPLNPSARPRESD